MKKYLIFLFFTALCFFLCLIIIGGLLSQTNRGMKTIRVVPEGMVLIPEGEFRMGSDDSNVHDSEKPVHTIYLDAFYIDIYEVTNAQYKEFIDTNPQWRKDRIPSRYHRGEYLKHWYGNNYPSDKGNHPVVHVSWYAAMAYAQWAEKRLPTEAEWEKAARGGLVDKRYSWGDSMDSSKANYGVDDTTPVGSYPPNGYGLYDMAGNVSEWCLDAYDGDFYKNSPRRNPIAGSRTISQVTNNFTNIKGWRVKRGGALGMKPSVLRVSYRTGGDLAFAFYDQGFRCAKTQ